MRLFPVGQYLYVRVSLCFMQPHVPCRCFCTSNIVVCFINACLFGPCLFLTNVCVTTYRFLDLSCTSLDDAAAEMLATAIDSNPDTQLHTIVISNNKGLSAHAAARLGRKAESTRS